MGFNPCLPGESGVGPLFWPSPSPLPFSWQPFSLVGNPQTSPFRISQTMPSSFHSPTPGFSVNGVSNQQGPGGRASPSDPPAWGGGWDALLGVAVGGQLGLPR